MSVSCEGRPGKADDSVRSGKPSKVTSLPLKLWHELMYVKKATSNLPVYPYEGEEILGLFVRHGRCREWEMETRRAQEWRVVKALHLPPNVSKWGRFDSVYSFGWISVSEPDSKRLQQPYLHSSLPCSRSRGYPQHRPLSAAAPRRRLSAWTRWMWTATTSARAPRLVRAGQSFRLERSSPAQRSTCGKLDSF